jgi:hypothetical protein
MLESGLAGNTPRRPIGLSRNLFLWLPIQVFILSPLLPATYPIPPIYASQSNAVLPLTTTIISCAWCGGQVTYLFE